MLSSAGFALVCGVQKDVKQIYSKVWDCIRDDSTTAWRQIHFKKRVSAFKHVIIVYSVMLLLAIIIFSICHPSVIQIYLRTPPSFHLMVSVQLLQEEEPKRERNSAQRSHPGWLLASLPQRRQQKQKARKNRMAACSFLGISSQQLHAAAKLYLSTR